VGGRRLVDERVDHERVADPQPHAVVGGEAERVRPGTRGLDLAGPAGAKGVGGDRGSGEPSPKLKFTLGSTRVTLVP
jgi:hypothetical protein